MDMQLFSYGKWRAHYTVPRVASIRDLFAVTQIELAKKVGTSVIARLGDAEYTGHSLTMLEHTAAVRGVALKLHAGKQPNFDREVALE
jgi:hypothetical protein